jgi:hypothetical protein
MTGTRFDNILAILRDLPQSIKKKFINAIHITGRDLLVLVSDEKKIDIWLEICIGCRQISWKNDDNVIKWD